MKTALRSAALFTSVSLALIIVIDLLLAFVYQGTPTEHLALHGILFSAVLVLSSVGSLMAFALLRSRIPSRLSVVISALLFGSASVFAIVWLFSVGGLLASGAWLLVGAALFSAGATFWSQPHAC